MFDYFTFTNINKLFLIISITFIFFYYSLKYGHTKYIYKNSIT